MCAELGVSETIKIIDFQVKNLELLREYACYSNTVSVANVNIG